jgi:diguanylate cyclase (GGDEF)-like protein/PAS domain S-box-containing protein
VDLKSIIAAILLTRADEPIEQHPRFVPSPTNSTAVTVLKRRDASFRLLFDNNPMPMWVFDADTTQFLGVNDAAVQHYGYSRAAFLLMKLHEIWPEDEWDSHAEALERIGDTYHSSRNWRHLCADGSEIEVLTFGRRVAFDDRDGYLVAVVDITERRKAEARIAHMAHHDGLTDLPNREYFQERLKQALDQAVGKRVGVLYIDLDLFKNINDSFGHPSGDRLLKEVAERRTTAVRGANLAARLGGDEFAVILAADVSPNEASACATLLIDMLKAPYDIDGQEMVIGASIGIALSPGDGVTSEELTRNADMALYRAKSDGGGVHHFFEREMISRRRGAATWSSICAARSPMASSSCTTSRWCRSPPTASPASSRCCAGIIPTRA